MRPERRRPGGDPSLGHRLLVLLLLAATLGYLILAWRIPLDPWSAQELVNSRTLPLVYGSLLALTWLALLARPAPAVAAPLHLRRLGVLLAVCAAFVWALPHAGIWLALAALLIAALFVMGERRPVPVAAFGFGIPAAGWLLVERLLGIYVHGPWS